MSYSLLTTILDDGSIKQESGFDDLVSFYDKKSKLSVQILAVHSLSTRMALMKLGWTPPKDGGE